jgi:hypothetical protein
MRRKKVKENKDIAQIIENQISTEERIKILSDLARGTYEGDAKDTVFKSVNLLIEMQHGRLKDQGKLPKKITIIVKDMARRNKRKKGESLDTGGGVKSVS